MNYPRFVLNHLIPSSPPSPVDQDSPPDSLPQPPGGLSTRQTSARRARVAQEWPQNWVLGADPEHRFEEYPKQQRLLALKKASANTNAVAPSYLPFAELTSLHPVKFEVILLDPPFSASFTWAHLQELPRRKSGCEVLSKWGYRRCEDVVWVRTNKTTNRGPGTDARTMQHCLISIRGTVRWKGDAADPTRTPLEMYTLIGNFCLGMRRLEVFGRARSSLRRGWVAALTPRMGGMGPMGMGYGFGGAAAVRRRGRVRGLLMRLWTC
ncbi:hypothetical protein FB451DRAFT_1552213 [Mycena latifolia]|nr:hypothetical protein FB451DRAFT_1552213 [Mycena latifolia]